MPKIALLLEYNGRKFKGSQYQAGVRTVQGELESALSTLGRQPVSCILSGRTDAGVHAAGQVAHFNWGDDNVDLWRLSWGLNGILDDDLSVVAAQIVPPAFHARFSAIGREYVYRILNRPQRSALLRQTHYFVPLPLDFYAMSSALSCLPGRHDFAAFKSTNTDTLTTVCHVQRAELLKLSEGLLEFWIAANHFVYNMVRIIVGTLLEIGLGKKRPDCIAAALASGNRQLAGPTAAAWGLCLKSVQYSPEYNLFASMERQNNSVLAPEN